MGLSKEAIKAILGIKESLNITPEAIARNLTVTFFPYKDSAVKDKDIVIFQQKLVATIKRLGVRIISCEDTLLRNNKIKGGVAVISVGEGVTGNLPIDNITNPRTNPIATIVKKPMYITNSISLENHMNIAIKLFVYYMANIVICVDKNSWMVYSLNGFSPFYNMEEDFEVKVLNCLIPKLSVPVRPLLISDLTVREWNLNSRANFYSPYIEDILKASRLFKKTALFPHRKTITLLSFRNDFYRKVSSIYLDERNGMSYGFFSRQLPVKISKPELLSSRNLKTNYKHKSFFPRKNKLFIVVRILGKEFYMPVPDVWVITTRSGCEKTSLDPRKDLIKLGLINGKIIMEVSPNVTSLDEYKPSFDTIVILSHAVANAIYGSILAYFKPDAAFPKTLKRQGMALAHWHGYVISKYIPNDWYVYGDSNPAAPCSSYQSAIYVFKGKEKTLIQTLRNNKEWGGDIHIEPQHGVNVTYSSLVELSKFMLLNPHLSKLGMSKII